MFHDLSYICKMDIFENVSWKGVAMFQDLKFTNWQVFM